MNKEELKKILFNYKRDKKRIDHIRERYYSMQSIKYDKDRVQSNKVNKDVENKVIALLSNPEYIELDKKVKAVECMLSSLSARQEKVFNRYFIEKRNMIWIEKNEYWSKSTVHREIEEILKRLEKEMV